jgi:hypothetical protein
VENGGCSCTNWALKPAANDLYKCCFWSADEMLTLLLLNEAILHICQFCILVQNDGMMKA